MSSPTVFYGAVINPKSIANYDAHPRCLVAVSKTGTIEWIVEDVVDSKVEEVMGQHGWMNAEVIDLKQGEFIIPGFIDTHTVGAILL